jgi:hypothetical protein
MELIVLSLIVGAFFILFFYISKIFKQQPAEAQNPTTGTDSGFQVLWIGIVLITGLVPDATFHFDADPDPAPSFTPARKSELLFTFVHSSARVLYFSRQCHMCRNFQYFRQ